MLNIWQEYTCKKTSNVAILKEEDMVEDLEPFFCKECYRYHIAGFDTGFDTGVRMQAKMAEDPLAATYERLAISCRLKKTPVFSENIEYFRLIK